jgi:hypothetical protein
MFDGSALSYAENIRQTKKKSVSEILPLTGFRKTATLPAMSAAKSAAARQKGVRCGFFN